KESLEQSIDQLQSQRLRRNTSGRSLSITSLSASDLDGGPVAESDCFPPTSPLKDYGHPQCIKRDRRSGVRFFRETDVVVQLHAFHQSLRDLSSEQVHFGDDLNRELSRRSWSDETKKALEELTEKLNKETETRSDFRLGRAVASGDREMHTKRELVERRWDQLGLMSLQLQEALKKQEAKADENEGAIEKIRQTETEKNQLEQELELCRRLLSESEANRETLLQQREELPARLCKAEGEKGLQQVFLISKQQSNHQDEQRRRAIQREKQDLEKKMSSLRAHLDFNALASELEEVKQGMERKDKEKAKLAAQVDNLTKELENKEKQQLQMLNQFKEIQNHFDTWEGECQEDLQISELTHRTEDSPSSPSSTSVSTSAAVRGPAGGAGEVGEDLKVKAQGSIRQWELEYKLERALEKQSETLHQLTDKNNKKKKRKVNCQLFATLQQMESSKVLNDVLTKRALQERELQVKEEILGNSKSQHVDLELEVKNSLETIQRLENELKQSTIQSQMKTEKVHLEEEVAELKKSQALDKAKLLEMQESIKDRAIRADLANKLAEEKAKKAVLKELSALKAQVKSRDEETATVITQLLEQDVHQRELKDLTASLQSVKGKHVQNIQELMKHFKKEKSEAENHIRTLKAESLKIRLAKVHHCQLEKLKSQCDGLTEELTQNENENKKLKEKYQCLKNQLEEKEKYRSKEEDHLRRTEEARLPLKDQLLLETERESILSVLGKEIDAACKIFSRDLTEKLKGFSSGSDIHYDSHRWLGENKTELQWHCEELKERKQRKIHQLSLCRQQLRDLSKNKETELTLFEQIERQEQLLEEIHWEKRG
uniref:Centrosomal protein 128 n=1 Tax=Otolemur garnettii TaxID=30611 RepID=H0XYC5_OTOGA